MPSLLLLLLGYSITTSAQQVYIPTQGSSARPYCSTNTVSDQKTQSPSYYHTKFSYTQTETVRTATPAISSTPYPTYGPSYAVVSHLVPNLSTTSWGNWSPNNATARATNSAHPYNKAAFSQLWNNLNPPFFTRGIYSTTVAPTPIPSSELVLPPPLYFAPNDCYYFPNEFILGVAGSASQVEGAVADQGRAPALPEVLDFGGALEGEIEYDYVTLENYYLYKQDITRLAAMGIKHYSFSIPWSRILPFAIPNSPVNSQALQHYSDLIDFAIAKGMSPIVTLLHADTPLSIFGNYTAALSERSYFSYFNFGYQSPGFQDAFVNYGKIVMSHFADRVPIWLTINEPQNGAVSGPSFDNVLKAHARLAHFYKDEIKGSGKISLKMSGAPGIPLDPRNASHLAAVEHYNDLNLGTFLYPLALGKDYPEAFKMTIQDYVPLSKSDLAFLNGTIDFIAIDSYTTSIISPAVASISSCAADNSTSNPFYPSCVSSTEITSNGWNIGYRADYYMWTTPTYLRTGLNYLWNTFRAPIIISEFGFPTPPLTAGLALADDLFDVTRSEYYLSYMSEVLKAIWLDGVEMMGVLAWSWADNWEFGTFDIHFGLQANNRTSQDRSYRRSFFDLVDFVETRRIKWS